MADFSIGDRVEVRWQAKPFAASVIHVHSPGKVDVVYDIDGSVGVMRKRRGEEERRRVVAPTKSTVEGFAHHMVGSPARSAAAPPRRKHGGCASNTAAD